MFPSEKIKQGDMDTVDDAILQAVYDILIEDSESVSYPNIAKRVTVSQNSVARRMRRLEQDGFVWRSINGRSAGWMLTPKGLPRIPQEFDNGSHALKRHKFVVTMARQAP